MTDLILISDSAEGFAIRRRIFAVEHEVSAEIFLSDNRIFCQLLRSALKKDLSFKKQVGSVGDAQCLLRVMVCYENADIFFLEMIDHRLDILDRNRVDSRKRLVEHDEFRVDSGQRAISVRRRSPPESWSPRL